MSAKRLVCQHIELTGLHINLELRISGFGIKGRIPPTKRSELVRRELFNLLCDRFDFAHERPFLT
jgi:hypothetical protein